MGILFQKLKETESDSISKYIGYLQGEVDEIYDGGETESQTYAQKLINILNFAQETKNHLLFEDVKNFVEPFSRLIESSTQTEMFYIRKQLCETPRTIIRLELSLDAKQTITDLEKKIANLAKQMQSSESEETLCNK